MQRQLDYTIAEDAKQVGIMLSEDKANRETPGWSEQALSLLKSFLLVCAGDRFLTETFREYARAKGLPEPNSKRAFGGVIVKAKRMGLIKFAGFGLTRNPLAHRTPASLWTKA